MVGVDPGTYETAETKPRAWLQACYSLMSRPHRRPRVPRRPEARPGLRTLGPVSAARGAGRDASFCLFWPRAPRERPGGGDAQADAPPTVPGPGADAERGVTKRRRNAEPQPHPAPRGLSGWREDASPRSPQPRLGRARPTSEWRAARRRRKASRENGLAPEGRASARRRRGDKRERAGGRRKWAVRRRRSLLFWGSCCWRGGLGRLAGAGRADRAAPRRSAALGSVRSHSPRPAGPTWRRTWPST